FRTHQGSSHYQRATQRTETDVRLRSLSDGSNKSLWAEIRCVNGSESRNTPALLNSFLIGCQRVTRRRVLIHTDCHLLRLVAICVNDASCRFRIADRSCVLAGAHFLSGFRKEARDNGQRDDYVASKQGAGCADAPKAA